MREARRSQSSLGLKHKPVMAARAAGSCRDSHWYGCRSSGHHWTTPVVRYRSQVVVWRSHFAVTTMRGAMMPRMRPWIRPAVPTGSVGCHGTAHSCIMGSAHTRVRRRLSVETVQTTVPRPFALAAASHRCWIPPRPPRPPRLAALPPIRTAGRTLGRPC